MKYYFIINPKSGGGISKSFIPKIKHAFISRNDYYKIITTTAPNQAEQITRELCKTGEEVRIYAVGGDGTLFDVVNGAAGYKNAAVGVIPCGSGNDFVKSFGNKQPFLNISDQIDGSDMPLDLIKFEDKYSINICCMGMDAEVVDHHNRHRLLSKINGSLSYTCSVFSAFIFNMNNHFRLIADDEELEGTYLFVVVANGRYYGGGFNPTPYANLRDGIIDLLIINSVSRVKVVQLMNKYRRGEHLDIEGLCIQRSIKHLEVYADKVMSVNLDGEVFKRDKAIFDIVHNGIRFVLPSVVNVSSPEYDEQYRKRLGEKLKAFGEKTSQQYDAKS